MSLTDIVNSTIPKSIQRSMEQIHETDSIDLSIYTGNTPYENESSTIALCPFLIDVSGSMDDHSAGIVGGMKDANNALKESLNYETDCDSVLMQINTFNERLQCVHPWAKLHEMNLPDAIVCGGYTHLYDALLAQIVSYKIKREEFVRANRVVQGTLCIFSDGGDNGSTIPLEQVRKELDSLRNDSHPFYTIFVGFGSYAINTAENLGFEREIGGKSNKNTLIAIDQLPNDNGRVFRRVMGLVSQATSNQISQICY
jgi:hypothetical protein